MGYRNELYKILRNMSESCEYHVCYDCPYKMEDICIIEDLFYDLSVYSPRDYEEAYINWFNRWEVKYNELYK